MQTHFLPLAENYAKQHKRRKIWQRIVRSLVCVVVFVTTYMLILPAITMEETAYCGYEAHTHDESCYEMRLICGFDQESTVPETTTPPEETTLSEETTLPEETAAPHVHGEECYEQEQVLICELEESVGHVHDETCVQTEQTLICTDTAEDHEHSDACFETTQINICGLAEGEGSHTHGPECYETNEILICELPETEEPPASAETVPEETQVPTETAHVHSEACYEKVLICEKEAHEHELICYSDPEADVESEAVWERSVSGVELTGNWGEDVVAIAQSQLGYQESPRNYTVTEDGQIKGYTRYGAWYGDPYGDWCAMFVSFCLHYAQVDQMPLDSNCQSWIDSLKTEGLYVKAADHVPNPGELIFFDHDADGDADHVGIVEEITETSLITIEGNSGDCVARNSYASTDATLLGYGLLPAKEIQMVVQTAVIYTDSSYQTLAEDGTVITLTGYLPENAQVRAFPVEVETQQQVLCAYDISIILPDGTLFEPSENESITVSIQSPDLNPESMDENLEMEVYYVPEEGEPELVNSATTEEGVCFDTTHFSVYMVLAVDSTAVSTQTKLKEAITAGDDNIQLGSDFTVSESLTIPASANITLDLNGHTLTANGSGVLFTVPEGATLTIVDSQQGAETVETASGSLAGNTASLSNGTLTYYVTTTRVTNSATGATQEALEKHTVSAAGAIVGGSQPVFQVTGGTLNLQSGMIRSGTGRAIVQTGGTTNLSGGYVCGFTQSSSSTANTDAFGGAIRASGGTLNLSGSVLAGNTAQNGGAIYATGSTQISITAGVISGNTANRVPTNGWNGHSESGTYRCGGGGIYSDENVEITMSGGYITNNVATDTGYFDGGGGVCLSGTSSMALSGGYVTGNQAQGGGGIRTDFGKETTFVMTGAYVSSNVATTAEGGGITIDRNGIGTVTAGYITNNIIPETVHWGGGGLFCADGSTLNLKNTLITGNTAGGFGAGVAGCPTGKLYLYVTEGCAIYDNTDIVDGDSPHYVNGGAKDGIDAERCTEVFQSNGHADYFCALNSTVTGTMLGNNAANWQGSADYSAVIADAEDVLTATKVMGLQAHPTEAAKSAAQAAAKVYINGNYSYTHGGGIMCNGNLVIGVPVNVEVPARIELQATKRLVDGSGNAQSLEDHDFSFKVTMTDPEGTVVAEGTCDSSGNISFDHQLTFKQAGTFVYYVYEEVGTENATVTYDSTLYRLSMTVTKDNGVAWYGDTIKYTYSVTSVKVESSKDGETWTQVSQNNTSQSGVISLPLTSGTTFTNHLIEPTKVTVQKKWEGGAGADSVTVILKKDGEEFDRQTLNAGNSWTYTWDDLEQGHSYTVEEVPVDGYTASYQIITSTDDSGSTSLGQGSWWVPATELTAGQQYLIVSPDGTKALYISSAHQNRGFDSSDVANVTIQTGNLTVGGQTYSIWYSTDGIDSRSIFTAQTRDKSGHTGTILKCNGASANTWLLVQSANSNHLKSTSASNYASNMVFENGILKGHENYDWNPTDLRTVIYADGKFNTTTEQNPANAAKLYTLVSGEGFTGATTDSTTVIITNTKEPVSEYELPETGGPGTHLYTIGGLLLIAGAGFFLLYSHLKRRRGVSTSS